MISNYVAVGRTRRAALPRVPFAMRLVCGLSLNMDPAYLKRLRAGEKVNPSATTLRKLRLRKIVSYEPLPLNRQRSGR